MKRKVFTIWKRNGEVDAKIKDGVYSLTAKITIKDGAIKFIDNGFWVKVK